MWGVLSRLLGGSFRVVFVSFSSDSSGDMKEDVDVNNLRRICFVWFLVCGFCVMVLIEDKGRYWSMLFLL